MSFFNKKNLNLALRYSIDKNLFKRLDGIYAKVPGGDCLGCGNCCMESVGASVIEFLNIYEYLKKNNILQDAYERVFEYYFKEYTKKMPCPFKQEDNKCLIYEVRPLNCRIYGNWKEDDYEKNYQRIKNENNIVSNDLKNKYDLDIPKEVVDFKINYCKEFIPSQRYMTKEERLELHDLMINLDSNLIIEGGFDLEFKDRGIVEYFVEQKFSEEMAFSMKIKIAKDVNDKDKIIKRLSVIQRYI